MVDQAKDPFAKLNNIKPGAAGSGAVTPDQSIEAVAAARGFVEDRSSASQAPQRRYRKKPGDIPEPTTTATLRPLVKDWNTFVDFCEKERVSYSVGFGMIVRKAQI
jgi:hypothetical protein